MTASARTALVDIGTNRQGSTPGPLTPEAVLKELFELGLIGKGHGLTRKGSIKREMIVEELFDAQF